MSTAHPPESDLMTRRHFSVGGIRFSLGFVPGRQNLLQDPVMEAFSVEPSSDVPDILFSVDAENPVPDLSGCRSVYSTVPDGLWSILEDVEREHYFVTLQRDIDPEPILTAMADRDFSRFTIYARQAPGKPVPFLYPFDEMVLAAHANMNRIGILLHSACVVIDGRGYLFAGTSGAGKSTMARIWQQVPGAEVLTDERVILREQDGQLWAFGTPWHGTAQIHRNEGAPLAGIFFIRHGEQNRVRPMTAKDAANRMLVRCFPAFWHAEGMQFVLDFCVRTATSVPCRELDFLPDVSAAEYVRKLVG